jgi:DNA-binding MarR family transcriptional regulator
VDVCVTEYMHRYPQIDREVEGAVERMTSIDKHISRAFEQTLADHGLSHGEYKLLLRLATRAADHRMSAGELSRALMLSSGAMTNRLDRLEAAGHIRRIPDPRDRRGVLVELTEQGERQIDAAVTEQAAREVDVLSALPAAELRQLNKLLRKVLAHLEHRASAAKAG